jgi:hypothetical protein
MKLDLNLKDFHHLFENAHKCSQKENHHHFIDYRECYRALDTPLCDPDVAGSQHSWAYRFITFLEARIAASILSDHGYKVAIYFDEDDSDDVHVRYVIFSDYQLVGLKSADDNSTTEQ